MDTLSDLLQRGHRRYSKHNGHEVAIFDPAVEAERKGLENLLRSGEGLEIHDTISGQVREWVKINRVSDRLSHEDLDALAAEELGDAPAHYGVWAYYSWSERLVHLLPPAKFAEVRTARNKYKITPAEQASLFSKRIGIIGLSVGQSAALTIAMERGCGELRLADFDRLDLSNLNRIRSGLHEIGSEKVINTAREIAELDPFIKVVVYRDGISQDNIDNFLNKDGKLDLLIEECDSLDVKILSRERARAHCIPVVMETSDRGMVDIERFDLEPDRPLLHGLAGNLTHTAVQGLTEAQKIPFVLKLTDAHKGSLRGKASMLEINQTIGTWPQLASSVVIGGGLAADVSRRILTQKLPVSGRFYFDPEDVLPSAAPSTAAPEEAARPAPLGREDVRSEVDRYFDCFPQSATPPIAKPALEELLRAAKAAPSTGNDQPWLFVQRAGVLFLFHDSSRSHSFGNYQNMASDLTFGAVSENIALRAAALGIAVRESFRPLGTDSSLEVVYHFSEVTCPNVPGYEVELSNVIDRRSTNRAPSVGAEIGRTERQKLSEAVAADAAARLVVLEEFEEVREAMRIIAECDRHRLMNAAGHSDFLNREMRFLPPGSPAPEDGIDINSLGLSPAEIAMLPLIRDYDLIRFLKEIGGGKIFGAAGLAVSDKPSHIALITTRSTAPDRYYQAGKTYERFWLAAETVGVAVHPQISPVYLFARLDGAPCHGFTAAEVAHLHALQNDFRKLFRHSPEEYPTFLTRIGIAHEQTPRSGRRKRDDVFIDG